MYNNFNNYGASSFGTTTSQYQGNQRQFQPTGYVQSFYGQNSVQGNQSYGQATSPESYHTANYRGNQMGHDLYLRADSVNPAQQQTGMGFQGGYSSMNTFGTTSPTGSGQFGLSQQTPYNNYRSTSQFGGMSNQMGMGNQFGRSMQSTQSYGQAAASPESYHTANYRGNQMGHDAYLRADSVNPAQQQTGMGFQGGYSSMNSFGTTSPTGMGMSSFGTTSPTGMGMSNFGTTSPTGSGQFGFGSTY
jgi:hypothetical protein